MIHTASLGTTPDANRFFLGTRFRAWFPIFPFLAYWLIALALYEWGPINYPHMATATYLYLVLSISAFITGYKCGLGTVRKKRYFILQSSLIASNGYALRWLRILGPISFIGCLGFALDRLLFSGVSISKVLNETQVIREVYSSNTTWLTTLCVLPYSLSIVTLALYFYCIGIRLKIPKFNHWYLWGMMAALSFNAFLSTNRGIFFWILTYVVFLSFFVKGERIRALLFQRRYRLGRNIFFAFLIVAVSYIYFISRFRTDEIYLANRVNTAMKNERYDLSTIDIDNRTMGALLELNFYCTHQFEFIDAFVEQAPWVAFDPIPLLGGRMLDQYRKINSDYTTYTDRITDMWRSAAGLSIYAWPSVLGWNLGQFGYVGAIVFMFLLAFVIGKCVRHFLVWHDAASLILIFSFYSAINMAYNSIGGDLTHNIAYLVGFTLLYKHKAAITHHTIVPNTQDIQATQPSRFKR